jgi:hypothetical protein
VGGFSEAGAPCHAGRTPSGTGGKECVDSGSVRFGEGMCGTSWWATGDPAHVLNGRVSVRSAAGGLVAAQLPSEATPLPACTSGGFFRCAAGAAGARRRLVCKRREAASARSADRWARMPRRPAAPTRRQPDGNSFKKQRKAIPSRVLPARRERATRRRCRRHDRRRRAGARARAAPVASGRGRTRPK